MGVNGTFRPQSADGCQTPHDGVPRVRASRPLRPRPSPEGLTAALSFVTTVIVTEAVTEAGPRPRNPADVLFCHAQANLSALPLHSFRSVHLNRTGLSLPKGDGRIRFDIQKYHSI